MRAQLSHKYVFKPPINEHTKIFRMTVTQLSKSELNTIFLSKNSSRFKTV